MVTCITFLEKRELDLIKENTQEYIRNKKDDSNRMVAGRTEWARTILKGEPIWVWCVENTKWSDISDSIYNMYGYEFADRALVVCNCREEDLVPVSEVEIKSYKREEIRSKWYPAICTKLINIEMIFEPDILDGMLGKVYYCGGKLSYSNNQLDFPYDEENDYLFKNGKAIPQSNEFELD